MNLSGNGFREKYTSIIDRFGTDRNAVDEIFVDETLLQIDRWMVKATIG